MEVKISEIVIGKRHRKDLGDIDVLAESIQKIGLLHPIVILADKTLVVGERRLAAFKKLKRSTIPANVANNLQEMELLLAAECEENTCRKDFTPEEAVIIGERIEAIAREQARKAQEEGRKNGGGDKRSGKAKEERSGKSFTKAKRDNSKRASAVAAAAVGMSHVTYEKAKEVVEEARKNPETAGVLLEEMNRTGKVSGAAKKLKVQKQAEAIASEPPPLPTGPFRVIVVDPPWKYDNRADDASHRASNPYPSMSIEEIKGMDIGSIAHADSVLWMWTTNSHIPESFAIVEAWGFTYKTILTWVKDRMGTGDWLRGKTEHCLLCVKGKPTIKLTNQTTAISGPMREHSRKPEEFYELVEELCPGAKMGDSAQKEWALHVASKGNVVLPSYGLQDVAKETKAPVLFYLGGNLVAPDMLIMSIEKGARWNEVKSKAEPSFYRIRQRWEHGCDYSLFEEYSRVEKSSGAGVFIIVSESKSPENEHKYSRLLPSNSWLSISLATARICGERRPNWPGGERDNRRGRRGMGGFLWPRSVMMKLDFKSKTCFFHQMGIEPGEILCPRCREAVKNIEALGQPF